MNSLVATNAQHTNPLLDAARLLAIVTGQRDTTIDFRLIPESAAAKAKGLKPRKYPGCFSTLRNTLARANADGFACYFLPANTDGEGVKRANLKAARALVLDLDGSPLPAEWEVPPHAIVETSPDRFQVWWAIEPEPDLEAVERVAKRLAARYGGDAKSTDASHVFRLPGFLHQKGEAFRSRLVKAINPADVALKDGFHRLTLAAFDFLPPIDEPTAPADTAPAEVVLDADAAAKLLDHLKPQDFAGEDAWRPLAMAVHDATGGAEEARDIFLEWCACDPAYADAEGMNAARWNSFSTRKGKRVTIGTLIKICRDHDVPGDVMAAVFPVEAVDAAEEFADQPVEESKEIDTALARDGLRVNRANVAEDSFLNTVVAIRKSGLEPAFSDLKKNVIFRGDLPWDEAYGNVLNDQIARMVRVYLSKKFQGLAFEPGKENVFEALQAVAYSNRFNPVLDYLDSLTWDGTPRVAKLFAGYFGTADDAYSNAIARCFMIGAVRRMRKPGVKFDTMPILRGPQGVGKSTAVRVLFSDEWYSDADLGNLHNKDAPMKLRGVWVQEFSEVESLSRADTGTLKAFCSRATDRERDPYGRVVEDSPRRCVFIATVNEGGYLKDSTGARRFWPVDVRREIDLAALKADRDQLWAEAAAMEAAGESDVLPRELWDVAAQRQEEQTSRDPWADVIQSYIEQRQRDYEAKPGEGDEDLPPAPPPDRVHTSELFDALGIPPRDQTKDKAQRLRTVMESVMHWHHRRGVRVGSRTAAGYVQALSFG